MTTNRLIASYTYQNGRWDRNKATLRRDVDGWTVCNGYYDPTLYRCPIAAKAAFRRVIALHSDTYQPFMPQRVDCFAEKARLVVK